MKLKLTFHITFTQIFMKTYSLIIQIVLKALLIINNFRSHLEIAKSLFMTHKTKF